MSEALPQGWVMITLGEVTESLKNGIYKPSSFYCNEGIACLRMYNILDGEIVWRDIKRMRLSEDEIEEYQLLPGDLLVNRVNSRELVGKSAVFPEGIERCVFESKNIRVRLFRAAVSPSFVNYRMLHAGSAYFSQNAQQVVGMASINQPQVSQFPLPLPPRDEQDRIVAKLNALLSRVAIAEAAARRGLHRLQRYRAAVLDAAVTGKLTSDWRTNHPAKETGAQLLQRVLATRRVRWEKAEFADLVRSGKTPKNEKWKARYNKPSEIATAQLPHLPHGWHWASLDQLLEALRNGIAEAPRGDEGLPLLRISAVRPLKLNLSDRRFLPSNRHDAYQKFAIREGDLLFTRYSGSPDLVGSCARVREITEVIVYPDKLIRGQSVAGFEGLAAFIEIATNCGVCRDYIKENMRTTAGQWGISGSSLRQMPVPLPPLIELDKIVHEVGRRLTHADRLATSLETTLVRARAWRQSLLQTAFAGRLVPQSARDEPASVLLKKTRALRDLLAPQTKPKYVRHSRKKNMKTERRKLLEVLEQAKAPLTPEDLFAKAGFNETTVEAFFLELKELLVRKRVVEKRDPEDRGSVRLEVLP